MAMTPQKTDEPVKKTASTARSKTARSNTKTATAPEGAAKASAVKKAAAPKAASAKKPATPKAPATKKKASQAGVPTPEHKKPAIPELTPDQRRLYVEVAAYYIAERRGFQGGSQMDDWVQAEAEIDRLLREGILKP